MSRLLNRRLSQRAVFNLWSFSAQSCKLRRSELSPPPSLCFFHCCASSMQTNLTEIYLTGRVHLPVLFLRKPELSEWIPWERNTETVWQITAAANSFTGELHPLLHSKTPPGRVSLNQRSRKPVPQFLTCRDSVSQGSFSVSELQQLDDEAPRLPEGPGTTEKRTNQSREECESGVEKRNSSRCRRAGRKSGPDP